MAYYCKIKLKKLIQYQYPEKVRLVEVHGYKLYITVKSRLNSQFVSINLVQKKIIYLIFSKSLGLLNWKCVFFYMGDTANNWDKSTPQNTDKHLLQGIVWNNMSQIRNLPVPLRQKTIFRRVIRADPTIVTISTRPRLGQGY